MKLSYAITVCNELNEIKNLVPLLLENKEINDEIVILYDNKNGDEKVLEFLTPFNKLPNVQTWRGFGWENNFSVWKNKLNDYCNGDYIFNIDADELITKSLIKNIHNIIKLNPKIDLFFFPRINIVDGITDEYIVKWGWKVSKSDNYISDKFLNKVDKEYEFLKKINYIIDEKVCDGGFEIRYYIPLINEPDYQGRLFKKHLRWSGKVHEKIVGAEYFSFLPKDDFYSIKHKKTIEKQLKQNNFYSII